MSTLSLAFSHSFLALAIALLSSSLAAQTSAPAHAPSTAVRKRVEIPPAPQLWLRTTRLAPADPIASGNFGQSVAVDGDTIAARQRGNAYVFVRDVGGTWTQEAKLVPPHVDESSEQTVALGGDNLVIGRPQDSVFTLSFAHGTAWIYHRDGVSWSQEAVAGGLPVGQIGKDVAVVDDTAVVAGVLTDDSVNVRRRIGTSWSIVQSIPCCPGAFGFIQSIAMEDATLVFVTRGVQQGDFTGHKVHFYRYAATWDYRQSITATGTEPNDEFGIDTELSGDHLAVGSPRDDAFGVDAGSVFTYVRVNDAWSAEMVLAPCDAGVREFGGAVALSGTTMVVSAKQYMGTEVLPGYRSIAYVLELASTGWEMRQKLTIPNPPVTNEIGISLAMDEQRIVIGSMSDDDPVANAGALYVFERQDAVGGNFCFGDGSGTACPCSNPGQAGNGCANAYSAAGARLDAYGMASIADDRLLLACRGVTPGTSAFFVQGDAREANGAGVPYRDGLRCIAGSLVSLGAAASCDGNATFPPAHVPPLSVLGSIPPVGATRYYQVRYASPGPCGTGTNFTNAVAIVWTP